MHLFGIKMKMNVWFLLFKNFAEGQDSIQTLTQKIQYHKPKNFFTAFDLFQPNEVGSVLCFFLRY